MFKEEFLNNISNLLKNLKFKLQKSFEAFKKSSYFITLSKYFDFVLKVIKYYSIEIEALDQKSITFKKFKSSFTVNDELEEPIGVYLKKGSRYFTFFNFNKIPFSESFNLKIKYENLNSDFKNPYPNLPTYDFRVYPIFRGLIPKDNLNYYYNNTTNIFLRMSTLRFRFGVNFLSNENPGNFCDSLTCYLWIYIQGFIDDPINNKIKMITTCLGINGPIKINYPFSSNGFTWRKGLVLDSMNQFIDLEGELDLNSLIKEDNIWANSIQNYSKEEINKDLTTSSINKSFGFFLNGDLNNGIDIKTDSNYYLGGNGLGDKEINENFYFYENNIYSRVLRTSLKNIPGYALENLFHYNPKIEIYFGVNFTGSGVLNLNLESSFYNGIFSLSDKKYPVEFNENYGWIKTLHFY